MSSMIQDQKQSLMRYRETAKAGAETRKSPALSPELREFLHLLKSLEADPPAKPAAR